MGLKKLLGIASLIGSLLYAGTANAGTLRKRVYPAHDGTSSVSTPVSWQINDGSSGVQDKNVNSIYSSGVDSGNFTPPPSLGDTIKSKDSLQVGADIYTGHMRSIYDNANITLPPGFIDDPKEPGEAHTFGIWTVDDTANIGTIKGEGWLNKNPGQKIPFWNFVRNADTVDLTDIYGQVYLNTEKQDSIWNQGDSATIRLYKEKGDTTWESDTTFPIDTLKHGGATMLENMVFPERMYVTDTTPPEIDWFTSGLPDTNNPGPYGIEAKIYDESGVDSTLTKLNFCKNGIWDSVNAYQINPSDSTWKFSIPKVDTTQDTVRVEYSLEAVDASPNQNSIGTEIGPNQSFLVDAKKPSISYSDSLEDGIYRGPFSVRTIAWDATGIDPSKCSLEYELDGAPSSAPADSFKADTSYFTIPEVPGTDTATVSYSSKIADNFGNYSETPEHSFKLKTNGVPEGPMKENQAYKVWCSRGKLYFNGAKNVTARDIAGRFVKSYENASSNTTGAHKFEGPSGVFFVTADEGVNKGNTKKIVNVK